MELEILDKLASTIQDRKNNPREGSYTNALLSGGVNKIVKKLGEENAEFIKAFLTEPNDRIVSEACDIFYHLLVALAYKDIEFSEFLSELKNRFK